MGQAGQREREGRGVCVAFFLGGGEDGRPEISPPQSFLKDGTYASDVTSKTLFYLSIIF